MPDDEESRMIAAIDKYSKRAYYSFATIDDYVDALKNSDINKSTLHMLNNISQRISHNANHTRTEDGFTLNVIDPVLNAYFDKSIHLLFYQGNDCELPESKARNDYQDTSHVSGRKADRSALIDISNHADEHTAYICEMKTAATSKHRPDLPKAAAMLKDMLNATLECYVSNQAETSPQ